MLLGADVKRNMTLCVVKALIHKEEEICVCGNVCVRKCVCAEMCACAGFKEVFTIGTPLTITADCAVLLMKVYG